MKTNIVQPMRITRTDGSEVTVCCGPAALQVGGIAAFTPLYEQRREGTCCHTLPAKGRWG